MNDLPRETLRRLLVQHGHSLCEDPRRCEALLRDLCGEHRREIAVLVMALKEGVAADLLASQEGVPKEVLLARLAQRLHGNLGLAKDIARWAVETWAVALGVMLYADQGQAVVFPPGDGDEGRAGAAAPPAPKPEPGDAGPPLGARRVWWIAVAGVGFAGLAAVAIVIGLALAGEGNGGSSVVVSATDTPKPTLTVTRTATSGPAAAPTAAASGRTYIVQEGDYPAAIAERFGISVDALAKANGITDLTSLKVGQVLVIPTPAAVPSTPTPALTQAPTATSGGALPVGKIVFSSRRDGNSEVYLLTRDGERNLTNDPSEDIESDFSPDGKKIVFASDRDDTYDIYVMDADGSNLMQLTSEQVDDVSPRWSPDGELISFSRTGDIYVMASDGSNQRQVTQAEPESTAPPCKAGAFQPDWSPDETKLVFYAASASQELGQICTIDIDGSNLTVVVSEPAGYHVEPSWSPDGQWIAYRSIRDGNHEIRKVHPDGTGDTSLTNNPAIDIEPAWSPDGQWIAFSSDRTGGFDLYMMRADGSEQTRLTSAPSKDSDPAWGP